MSRLERYTIERTLGSGGQGTVLLARDGTDGQLVAIKQFNSSASARAVRREVAALQLLRLPGVVELIESGLDADPPWLVERYVPGEHFPGGDVPMPWDDLMPRLRSLLRVLLRVHGQGVIHGDLKPQNVLVSGHRVTLIDLALASGRSMEDDTLDSPEASQPYTAQELLEKQPPTPRSDLFAVGVMAYQALTGELPWPSQDAWAYALAMRSEPPTPLAAHGVRVSPAVEALLIALLGKPPQRPRSAAQALERLERTDTISRKRQMAGPSQLNQSYLAGLFAGPERLLHLPSRAARELHRRTDGLSAQVSQELWHWELDGLITWKEGQYALTTDALGRLKAGEGLGLERSPQPLPDRLKRPLKDLLAWLALAWPHTEPERLAGLLKLTSDQLNARLDQLRSRRLCELLEDGRWRDLSQGATLGSWGVGRRARAHRELALTLPMGETGRLRHLLIGGTLEEAVEEAIAASQALAKMGRLTESVGVIELVLPWARGEGAQDQEAALLTELLASTLPTELPAVLQRTRQALLGASFAADHHLNLAEAALAALSRQREQAHTLLETVPPPPSERLECSRQALRVRIASQGPVPAHRSLLEALERDWAADRPGRVARLTGWKGQLAYRVGDFTGAAQLQLASAAARPEGHAQLSARLMAAAALLEAGDWAAVDDLLVDALQQAESSSNLRHTLRAERLRRACLYRSHRTCCPDEELLNALPHAHPPPYTEALIRLNEAAVCWHAGLKVRGAALASEAAALLKPSSARLLACALHHNLSPADQAHRLADEALAVSDPLISLQVLALLAPTHPSRTTLSAAAVRMAASLRPAQRRICQEVMSADEALAMLRGEPLPPRTDHTPPACGHIQTHQEQDRP